VTGLDAARIASFTGGELVGPNVAVDGVSTLDRLVAGHVAFIRQATDERIAQAQGCPGAVFLVSPDLRGKLDGTHIVVANPRLAFGTVLAEFFAPPRREGIAPTARVSPDAILGDGVAVGEYAVIGPGAVIGAGTEIRHHVVIAGRVTIGESCVIKSHAVVGEEGFATEADADGNNVKIPHVGGVRLGREVEVGATTVICGGTIDPTEIGDYTKIDDNVFVAHNCKIGRNCHLIATSEISGSVVMGDNVWIAPSVTIKDGVHIGADAYIGLGAVVLKDCDAGFIYVGNPAKKLREREP
jgi:UDP-3-O-[3-hydroxymyristoyl] glucosamine N-acyltransferase LpxD